MWSSGQVLIHCQGVPGLVLIALFAAGAVAAFGALQLRNSAEPFELVSREATEAARLVSQRPATETPEPAALPAGDAKVVEQHGGVADAIVPAGRRTPPGPAHPRVTSQARSAGATASVTARASATM